MSPSDERTRDFTAAVASDVDLPVGARIGDYAVQRVLGRGGFSVVYEGQHLTLGRKAALKVLHHHLATSPEIVQRFIREARLVNEIRHPGLVDVFDFGQLEGGRPWFAMELLSAPSLADVMGQAGGRLPVSRALELATLVCEPLDAAHRAGVVHRDLKASNVLVVGPRAVKLLDFGIAKLLGERGERAALTAIGQRLGTTHAMAPEQLRGANVDARADVYAMGVLLFSLLTGRRPFESEDLVELERLHLEAPPPRPSSLAAVPADVEQLVLRCLEKEPLARFADAGALLTALRGTAPAESRSGAGQRALLTYFELESSPDQELAASEALDAVETDLLLGGTLVPLKSGNSLLAVQPVPSGGLAARCAAAEEQAERCHQRLRASGATVSTWLHLSEVELRRAGQSLEVVGGPGLEVSDWAVDGEPNRVCLTPALRIARREGDPPDGR